ncbi:MAG: Gfo/Idh/MocA family oxidoreductase [Terracidiphilus sp.]|jgi:predicted dehydrogenase
MAHLIRSFYLRRRLLLPAFFILATIAVSAQSKTPPPLRVAIVGLEHGHVEGFLHALPEHPDVELVGIAATDPALFAKYQKKYSLAETLFYRSEANMIEKTHPQAVLVYTSVAEHRPAIEIAAQYGVSVMVEKPLTISLADALAIRATARHCKIHVLVNYETTWYASNKAAFDEVESGRIGAIRRVVIHDGHQGPAEIGVQPEFLTWLTDPAQNGAGALYDFGCYGVDLMTWLMHGETPLTVTAVVNQDKPQIYPHVDDDATVVLTYPHAQAVIQASWNWPFARKDMEVYGATGTAITVGADQVRLRHEHEPAEHTITAAPLAPVESNSLNHLAAVVRGNVVPYGDPDDEPNGSMNVAVYGAKGGLSSLDTNVVVMQILDAARESARTGKTVRLTKLDD